MSIALQSSLAPSLFLLAPSLFLLVSAHPAQFFLLFDLKLFSSIQFFYSQHFLPRTLIEKPVTRQDATSRTYLFNCEVDFFAARARCLR